VPIVIIEEEIVVKPRMLKQINIKDFLLLSLEEGCRMSEKSREAKICGQVQCWICSKYIHTLHML